MSTLTKVLLVILVLLVIAAVALYFYGRKLQEQQASQQAAFDAAKQTVSMLVIDKKKLRISQSGLPQMVLDQQPWYTKWMKVPIVKAKVGPRIMTFMADANVFDVLPLKTECKVVISGLYITEIKSARGGIPQVPKKKTLRDRISGVLTKKS
jgi:Flp pilus assembly protein CpaB